MEDQSQLSPALAAGPKDRYPIPTIKGNSTRRFLAVAGMTLVLWIVAWPFLTLAFLNRYDSGDAAWIRWLYQRKDSSLKRPAMGAGGRIVIVGGSGALYGIDAELIERKLGVTTVNYGTHAGLGGYLLDRARSAVRPGDTVLLCPEYELWFNHSTDFSDIEWAYVSSYDKSYIWSHGMAAGLRTLYSQPGAAYQDALSGWQYRFKYFRNGMDSAHNPVILDDWGDLRSMPARLPFSDPGGMVFPDSGDPACAVGDYRDFASWGRANRVRVLFSWPNEYQQAFPGGAPPGALAAPASTRALFDEWGFIALDEPSDTLYPRDWFTNTPYHPDAGCRRVRTEALIRRLRPYFGQPAVSPPAVSVSNPSNLPAVSLSNPPAVSLSNPSNPPAGSPPRPPAGLYLVGPDTNWLRPDNTFADQPGLQVKYLSPQPLDCPDAITPANVAALAARGVPIWLDDPNVQAMLPPGEWDSTEVTTERESLADWLARYNHHLFLLAHSGGVTSGLPPEVRAAFAGTNPAVAAMGTGRWAKVQRIRTGASTASIQVRLDVLIQRGMPRVWLIVQANAAGPDATARSSIQINSETCISGSGESIAVAVVDPELGTLVDAATFQPDATRNLGSLRKLTLRRPLP